MSSKVLVVDDNQLNARLLADILEDEGFKVYSISDAFEVIAFTHREKPDIILLDIMMPGMDGFQVCQLLKNDVQSGDIPVIMVTAKTQGTDIKRALDIGAFDYIKKPIDEIEVVARVHSALRFKKQQDQLKETAMKDGLTGIYNHALLMEFLTKEFHKQSRTGESFCFVMLDIDYFKKVNDTYGHTAGDMVLKELSRILVESVRNCDVVGRYGGEEFGLVLSGINADQALHLCERIRSSIEKHSFIIGDGNKKINITVSMGVCVKSSQEPEPLAEIVKKADEALYRAKAAGRNKVELSR